MRLPSNFSGRKRPHCLAAEVVFVTVIGSWCQRGGVSTSVGWGWSAAGWQCHGAAANDRHSWSQL